MEAALLVVVTLVASATVAALLVWAWGHGTVRTRVRRRAVVTCKTGQSFEGVVWQHDAAGLVLRDATAFAVPDQGDVKVDGEVLLLRGDIAYVQFP